MEGQFNIKSIFVGGVLLAVLYLFQTTIRPQPDYNWDAVQYMNLILEYDGVENDSIRHIQTYQHLKEEVPAEHFKLLADTDHWFRVRNYQSYEVFQEQIPFYSIKPIFIINCWVFYKMGFSLFDATWIPSLLCFFIIALIFYRYISSKKGYVIGAIATLMIMLTPPFMELSILSTPDAMGTMTLILVALYYLEKKSIWVLLMLSIATILIRPDHLIICGFFIGLRGLDEPTIKSKIKMIAIPSIILLGIHFFNFNYHHNPGWKVLFMHSFQGNIHYPLSMTEGRVWEWSEYLKTIKFQYPTISFFLWMILFPVLLFIPRKIKLKELILRRDFMVFLTLIITTVMKFFLFPFTIDRYYAPFYAIGILLLVYAVSKLEISVSRKE